MYLRRQPLNIDIGNSGFRKIFIYDTQLGFIIAPPLYELHASTSWVAYYAAEVFAEYAIRKANPVDNYFRYLLDVGKIKFPLDKEYYQAIRKLVGSKVYEKYLNCLQRQEKALANVS